MSEFKTTFAERIFKLKYALTQSETWHQRAITIVDSVCGSEGGQSHPLMSEGDRKQLVEYITEFKFIPGGRYLYYSGRAAKFYNNCGDKDTLVLTSSGFKKMGTFSEGESVEIYSPVSNQFEKSTMHCHGIQPINKITLRDTHNGQSIKVVKFTPNHKWLTVNRGITEKLQIGDLVPLANVDVGVDALGFIHGLVFADGNVHKRIKKKDFVHQLRLCGDKAKFVHLFENYSVTYPKFADGDPVVYIPSTYNFKEIPKEMPLDYIAGFLSGWLEFDGCKISDNVSILHSINKEALNFFILNAPLAGLHFTGKIRETSNKTNYGERTSTLFMASFRKANNTKPYKVIDITFDKNDLVYCPYEPLYNQIVIDHGIHTYQCYLLRAEEDTREEWSDLTQRAMSCLMTGGGVGIDYSRLRASGRILNRTGGVSSGPIPLMYTVNEVGRNVMQGGSRRSAIYASLNWQHDDAEQFLHTKNWHDMPVGKALKETVDR